MFQSSFELAGYITYQGLTEKGHVKGFQSSFELAGYITYQGLTEKGHVKGFQSSFELTGYITSEDKWYSVDFYRFKAFSSLRVI